MFCVARVYVLEISRMVTGLVTVDGKVGEEGGVVLGYRVVFWSGFGGFLGCGRAFLALVIVRQERGSEHLSPRGIGDPPRLGLIRYYLDGKQFRVDRLVVGDSPG